MQEISTDLISDDRLNKTNEVKDQMSDYLPYQILLNPTKRNVFLSVLNPNGQLIKLFTAGQLLKASANKVYYRTLRDRRGKFRDRRIRRLRRSMRMFVNTQKRTKLAAFQSLQELTGYIQQTKLYENREFLLLVTGSNNYLLKPLMQKLLSFS